MNRLVPCLVLVLTCLCLAGPKPLTGPATEKRFPALVVPAGFRATLFACDPLIEYPSAIALGPRPGTLFVAVDYLTGLGTEIDRRDEVRLIEDTDGDGHADRATVFAGRFNSIQGLAYHDGTLYVMHAPYLTALRDTDGDGKALERRDLLAGLGLPPEQDQIRLHNANGVVVGHDGWLYLALGDRGCDVKRPEGDRLVLHGGGLLRCRPDGRDLHVFARGLRNVYDVALDEELNVFVRDNENDGGDYKIRVCHSFFGADHGYPYLYHERPDEALAPLADLGLGSSAGAVCYLETQFPAEYRGSLLFCEWGRAVVRYPRKRAGASFATARETDLAAGAASDPYGFKPTDLVVDRDGSLLVSDWADGQRPRRGRGRIYRIRHVGKAARGSAARPQGLDSESHRERWRAQEALQRRGKEGIAEVASALKAGRLGVRGRLHGVWVLAKGAALEPLLHLAATDPEPRVGAQAVRAVADLADPVLVRHRLDAGRGDAKLARRLARWGEGKEALVQLEVVLALGRLRWAEAPAWLRKHLKRGDPAVEHAAAWTLRQSGNWPAVLAWLDEPAGTIARRAVAGQYDPGLVDGLIERLKKTEDAVRRRQYADLLSRVCRKPGPWTYWGFRPGPRPAGTVSWERTAAIEQALDSALARATGDRRLEILRPMLREKVPLRGKTLARWLEGEREPATVALLLEALRGRADGEARSQLEKVVRDRRQTTANRLLAVAVLLEAKGPLVEVAGVVEDGPVLAELVRAIGARKVQTGAKLVLDKLASPRAEVRAAAVGAVAELGLTGAEVRKLLDDGDAGVRAAAARAAGKLGLRPAAPALLKRARDADAGVRRASLEALRRLREPRALPVAVAALADAETAVTALECVAALGGPGQAGAVAELARRSPSAEILAAAGKVLVGWAGREGLSEKERQVIERALAEVHGGSGVLLGWRIRGPLPGDAGWRRVLSAGMDARVRLGAAGDNGAWLASCEVAAGEKTPVEFFTTSSAPMTVSLNDQVVYRRKAPGVPGPYPERFEATLAKGVNRVRVRLAGVKGSGEFRLRFRRKSSSAAHERLARSALSRAGNPAAGRKVFLAADKSLCLRCHRLGEQGERVGPDLTGLGSRFSKAYIIESILEPGRTVAPSFESVRIELKSGKVHGGIVVARTPTTITLVDSETKKHLLPRSGIDKMEKQPGSAMPDGLEKRMTEDEFVDLVSFLVSLKDPRRR